MDKITIVKNVGTPVEENTEIESEGYVLFYMDKAKAKITGTLILSIYLTLSPIFFAIAKPSSHSTSPRR